MVSIPETGLAVVRVQDLTETGVDVHYEARTGGGPEDIRWQSRDIDEVLAYVRSVLTGEDPTEPTE